MVSAEWDNVFDLWVKNGKVLPFRVRRWSWSPLSYFVVKRIQVSAKNWDYYRLKGRLYGRAFGDFVGKVSDFNIELNCAGCYQWKMV